MADIARFLVVPLRWAEGRGTRFFLSSAASGCCDPNMNEPTNALFAEVPMTAAPRKLVFVSHANPEDNEFAAWLGTRLIGAGYSVWSDLLRLIGGEPFWRDIGDAIKDHAVVVVLVLSRSACLKPGVLDEIALAVATGRKLGNPKFVIPVRLDDLPYDEFPEQVVRLNAINFNGNWAEGLHALLRALDDRNAPKDDVSTAQSIDEFRDFRLRQSAAITSAPETIEGSWLRIKSLPGNATLCRYGADPKTVAAALRKFATPVVPWDRLGFSFAGASEIMDVETPDISVEHAYDVNLQKFLAGEESGGPSLRRGDARRMMVHLMRQAWERFAEAKGLKRYEFANSVGWYVPRGLIDKDTVAYDDLTGKRRRKRLAGRSIKRGVYWSFAVTIHPVVGQKWHLELKPQVVFTEDGVNPIDSKTKMARLRKSFCKNWWNDQWRTLLRAFLRFLAEDENEIRISLGGSAEAVFEAEMMTFEAQRAIVGDGIVLPDEDIGDEETAADTLDDGIDIIDFDDLEVAEMP
ncbi:toll/interleukin-1 receptor domain-containing protein [Sphingobium sp. YC-XJ3]|uniref:toll/interleukin-1 receptor domain-containing protein n=1 Tax=Sphingobium sp. YC-XJ3 TaxID=3024245 RepID=UPI00235DDD59|nr:toll/interleukin-1 receptor domain-containing protein [Sphingobium sp. YC-XJ3]WDA39312.1 toll/interleukin-1 receptor domain-containing protein [Sphingobium sp. YC-XJ3]